MRGRCQVVSAFARLDEIYRRTGATLPFGDPLPSHGAEMEGYFWRVTDVARERVIVVLCGISRHTEGAWATVAVAAHPGGCVRSAMIPNATPRRMSSSCRPATARSRHPLVRSTSISATTLAWTCRWRGPWRGRAFSAGAVCSRSCRSSVSTGTRMCSAAARTARLASVKNRGRSKMPTFTQRRTGEPVPRTLVVGQAQGFDRRDVCVAFSGGVLRRDHYRRRSGEGSSVSAKSSSAWRRRCRSYEVTPTDSDGK